MTQSAKSLLKRVFLGIFALISACVFGVIYSSDLPVQLGEWNTNYAEAKALAESQSIPMVLFWGGASCKVCKAVEAAVDGEAFREWQVSRKLVMVFQSGTSGEMYEFTRNNSGTFPYICVYWPKSDGTAVTNRFSGVVKGVLPWPATGNNTAEHFMKSVESCIVGYEPAENNTGDFTTGDTDGDRLEAVPGQTKSVAVPLSRIRASVPFAATNRLVVTYPRKQGVVTNEVLWAEGDETLYPKIALPDEVSLFAYEEITVELLDSQDQLVGTRHIWLVEDPENSPKNPRWIGERTAESLEWGEWTVDIDVATNRAAAASGDAWTLVGIVGSLWCPDCFNVDGYFLNDPSVKTWAEENKVAFVSADIPNIGVRTVPTTLSYEVYTSTNRYTHVVTKTSGTGYLSRHEADHEDAAACLARNYYYAQSLYHRPEDPNKNRTGVPIFVLLNKQGEMVGRFTRLSAKSPTDSSHNAAYLKRLSEMIEMAGDPDELGNNHASTTVSSMAGQGGTFEGRISHADALDTVALTGLNAGAEVTVTASAGDAGRNVEVELSILEMDAEGVVTNLASQTGLLDGLAVTGTLQNADARWFAQISAVNANATNGPFAAESEESTITPYALAVANVVFTPGETAAANAAAVGESTVTVRLEADETYRLDGLAAAGWEETLEEVVDAEKKLYKVRVAGDVSLPVADVGGTLTYQLWHPGEVAFVGGDLTLEEKAGLVEVAVARTNGVSGAASVTVTADLSTMAAGRLSIGQCDESGMFTPGEPTLTWSEGEDGVRTFWLKVLDDEADDGDQSATLTLASADGTAVSAGAGSRSVTLLDDDLPLPGRVAITAVDPVPAKNLTVYVPAGETVEFAVSRLDGAEGEASATLTTTLDGEVTPGLLDRDALVWPDKCKGDDVTQTVLLFVPEDAAAGSKITVTLAATGAKTDSTAKKMTVVVNSVEAPVFKQTARAFSLARSARFSAAVETTYSGSGTLKVTKLCGSLPPGLKAFFSEGALQFAGTLSRAGTYQVAYRVTATEDGVSVPGGTVVLSFDVAEATDVCPALAKARTFNDIQIVDTATKRLVGLLTLTVPPTGRVSARYTSSIGRTAFTASGWDYNPDDATFSTVLMSTKEAFEFYEIHVTQRADGTVDIAMNDPEFPLGGIMTCSVNANDAWNRAQSAADWQGSYTVACPYLSYKAESNSDSAFAVHATGSPCFSLRMTAKSACNSGRMTYAGWLANGTRVTGSATLTRGADGKTALMPILARTGKEFFSAVCEIKSGMKAAWDAEQGGEFGFGQRAITAPADVLGWWTHTEKTEDATFSCNYDVYGSYWTSEADLTAILDLTGVKTDTDFSTDMTSGYFAESTIHGAVEEVPTATVTIGAQAVSSDSDGVTMRLDSQTGLVSGTFKAKFEKGFVTVNWRAAALPGWTGCGCHGEPVDLPFFVGAGWFQDRIYYRETDAVIDRALVLPLKRGCGVAAETKSNEVTE